MFEPSKKMIGTIEEAVRERGYKLARLTDAVRRLSDMFVRRSKWRPDYMNDPDLLAAYTAYYLPVNALKVRWVLEEMKRYAPGFLDAPRRVLDFGSGPGTALVGLAEVSDAPHERVAVDRVPNALELAARLAPGAKTATLPPEGRFDLILAANVYAEAESDDELRRLLEQLEPGGYLALIEPALKPATKRVMELRDRLAGEGWKIAAPCLAVPNCPMLCRRDLWCHMDVHWTRPGWIQRLDQRTGLEKQTLKFSYLVLTREGAGLAGSARLVSDLHREKGKSWGWFCGGAAELARVELLKRDRGEHNADFRHARRGDVLEIAGYKPEPQIRLSRDTEARKGV